MNDPRTAIIVGAGQAGRWLALTLRADGFTGRIVWFGDEPHKPYDRPPLSKAVLKGETALDRMALLPGEAFDKLATEWHPGVAVTAVDRTRRIVATQDGREFGYDLLFLACGGRARTLPGLPVHPRVHTLRTWDDAVALKAGIEAARRVIVIGGGWIGLEVAASARLLGREVTVVEAAERLCMRTVPAVVSEHLRALHERHGIVLRLGAPVRGVQVDDAGVRVDVAGGEPLHGDLLVVGIGLVAHDGLAAAAGLATAGGVLTDAWGRTEDPAVFAVGDVATERRDGARQRIESWEHAQRQAQAAAKAALGLPHDPDAEGPPWFWSDQYDDNLQLLGLPDATMDLVERHDPAKRQRLFFFCRDGQVRALAAVNGGREIKIVRKWMRERRFPTAAALADTGTELNKLPLVAAV